MLFAIDREDISGPINCVAPDPATNARFSLALGHALGRPSVVPAPSFALRPVLGEFANSLLSSQLMLPAVLQDAEFVWKHPHLEPALLDLLDAQHIKIPTAARYQYQQRVDLPLPDAFAILSDPIHLEQLGSKNLEVKLTNRPSSMQRGAMIEYRIRTQWMTFRWKTLVVSWKPNKEFEDVAIDGPFLLWRHRHEFTEDGQASTVQDSIDYILRWWPLSNVALPSVHKALEEFFESRQALLQHTQSSPQDA